MTIDTAGAHARAERAQAKRTALRALIGWQDQVWESLTQLAAQAGATGPDAVIVFEAADADPAHEDDVALREELVRATLYGHRTAQLGPGAGPAWQFATAVQLWDELREVLGHVYGSEMPASLLLDLPGRVVFGYDPFYCPDFGPEPFAVLELAAHADVVDDPFEALLHAADADTRVADDAARLDARLERLLEAHRIVPPTRPGHGPGEHADDH